MTTAIAPASLIQTLGDKLRLGQRIGHIEVHPVDARALRLHRDEDGTFPWQLGLDGKPYLVVEGAYIPVVERQNNIAGKPLWTIQGRA